MNNQAVSVVAVIFEGDTISNFKKLLYAPLPDGYLILLLIRRSSRFFVLGIPVTAGEVTYLKGIDPAYSVTKTNLGDGWLTLLCFGAIILIAITGNKQQVMNMKKVWWTVLIAFISLLISVYHAVTIFTLAKTNTGDTLVMKVSPGVGLYLTILVSLVLMILPFKHRVPVVNTAVGGQQMKKPYGM